MKIGVLGAGTMGAGIVQAFAQFGFEVVMRDLKEEFVERGIKTITKILIEVLKKKELQKMIKIIF